MFYLLQAQREESHQRLKQRTNDSNYPGHLHSFPHSIPFPQQTTQMDLLFELWGIPSQLHSHLCSFVPEDVESVSHFQSRREVPAKGEICQHSLSSSPNAGNDLHTGW